MAGIAAGINHKRRRAPVDLAHLSRQTLGDNALEREVLNLYLKQSLQQLDKACRAASAEERKAAAHLIRGSARGIGAWRVDAAADAAERQADEAALEALGAAIDEARLFIADLLEDLPGAESGTPAGNLL